MAAAAAEPLLAIVWHSRTGTAEAMARSAYKGAGGAEAAMLVRAREAMPDAMIGAGGYLFVCPENLAALSGEMKEMFDRCYYPLLGRIEGRPYATAIAAGSDGTGALRQLDRIVTGWRLKRVADSIVEVTGAQTAEAILAPKQPSRSTLESCKALGAAMAEGLRQGIF